MSIKKKTLLMGICLLPLFTWADATLKISGQVYISPCTVDTSTVNKLVDFGSITRYNMVSAGTGSGWESFSLDLKDCPSDASQVTVELQGNPDSTDPTAWENTGTSGNVALRVANAGHSVTYKPGDKLVVAINSDRKASFPMSAQIFTPQGNAASGTFRSVMNVEFTFQ